MGIHYPDVGSIEGRVLRARSHAEGSKIGTTLCGQLGYATAREIHDPNIGSVKNHARRS